jgi:lysophospholipase L1-like esterase
MHARPRVLATALTTVRTAFALLVQGLCLLVLISSEASAQPTYLRWVLAEGAVSDYFTEEILIANPNGNPANVTIRLLPESGAAPPVQNIVVPASSRYTFVVNNFVSGPSSVGALVESDQPIVVERSMYWANGQRRGGHNSQGVAAPSNEWYLAEGALNMFSTFVLISNSSATPAEVQVTFLREVGAPITTSFTIAGNGRKTIFVNQDFPEIDTSFSVVVRQTGGSTIVVERAMYWNGGEGGHESTAVNAPNTTWLFAEGATGNTPNFDFQTYLLLANPANVEAAVTIDFFRDVGGPVQYHTTVAPNSRKTLSLDDLPFEPNDVAELASASFSIKVTSDRRILAERSMYWSSNGIIFIDGHNTPGVNAEAGKWAFAEGRQGRFADSGTISYDSYFLFSNSSSSPLRIKGTFVREDATGIVRYFTVNPTSRFTLLAGQFPELSNQRFAAFFEAVDSNGAANTQTFVAERAMYWGDGYFGGHGSTGTPWPATAAIAPPPIADLTPTIASITPTHGLVSGGTRVTITGTKFLQNTVVEFGDRPATAIDHVSATQMIVTAPAGAAVGPVSVRVINTGWPAGTLANAFTYDTVIPTLTVDFVLAFGDSVTEGVTKTWCDTDSGRIICDTTTTPYPARLRSLLQARYPAQSFQVQNAGIAGECASVPGCSNVQTAGRDRLPTVQTSAQDVVVLLQGVNDLNSGVSTSSIINALRTMIRTARDAGKDAVICSLPPVKPREDNGLYKADPARIASLNAAIEALRIEENVPKVDIGAAFGSGYASLLSPDGLHPNAAGYQRMAEAIRNKLVEQFEIRP